MKPRQPFAGEMISIVQNLADATSAQATAGIAGLLLCASWLASRSHAGHIEVIRVDPTGYELRVDPDGVQALLDVVYAAETVAGKDEKDEKRVMPACPLVRDLDPSGNHYEIWRRGVFGTVHARAKQRIEHERRLPGGRPWERLPEQLRLLMEPTAPVEVSSTSLWGASRLADGKHKPHIEHAGIAFALQFRLLVAALYPIEGLVDAGEDRWGWTGWLLALPEVTDLGLVSQFADRCLQRPTATRTNSWVPIRSVMVHPEEAMCEYAALHDGMTEVYHIATQGNEKRTRDLIRGVPTRERLQEYLRSRENEGRDLRWARAEAEITGRPVDEAFLRAPGSVSRNVWFCRDASRLQEEMIMSKDEETRGVNDGDDGDGGDEQRPHAYANCPEPNMAKEPVRWMRYWVDRKVWQWLNNRAEHAAGGKWSAAKADAEFTEKYQKARTRTAEKGFYAIRHATKGSFLRWFFGEALLAPSASLPPEKRLLLADLVDTYWADACRQAVLNLSHSKAFRSKTTEQNGGLASEGQSTT